MNLPPGPRPFDAALAAALRAHWPDMPAGVDRLVEQLSLAVADGHSCLRLDEVAASTLRTWSAIGRGDDDRPLVLDPDDRLYLRRYWQYESRVATRLLALAGDSRTDVPAAEIDAALAAHLPPDTDVAQRAAIELALRRRLAVILGGPGTGKTWTLVRLIAALNELARRTGAVPPRIALAATTGKAAQRLGELASTTVGTAAGRDGGAHATTVHSLLGMRRDSIRARFNGGNPLPYDVVIVDEASMLDLPMFAHLLDALADDARLMLVGDPDQLASVEAGSVLAELRREHEAEPDGAIGRGVVTLRRAHRFSAADALARALAAVRAGDGDALFDALADDTVFEWYADMPAQPARVIAAHPALRALDAGDIAQRLRAFSRTRALAALREGPFGIAAINAAARRARGGRRDGEPVLVTANAPSLRLSNGDVGVFEDGDEAYVWFADAQGEGDAPRRVRESELPAHEPAWAMTVHKAQGSEFAHVLVVLPPEPHALVSREWLYTALSRARERVTLWATREALAAAVAAPARRQSGLRARLHERARRSD
jgi:exodeoxyribonuclease V alpha subunit